MHTRSDARSVGRANPIVATGLFTLQATSNKMGPGSIFKPCAPPERQLSLAAYLSHHAVIVLVVIVVVIIIIIIIVGIEEI